MEGGDAITFDSHVYGKACKSNLWHGCKNAFSFDPGGWVGRMSLIDWEIGIWPFDPGGCLRKLACYY